MGTNRYGKVLTIILVILIIAVLIIIGVLVYKYVIEPNMKDKRTIEAISEFDKNVSEDNGNNTISNETIGNMITNIVPTENVPSGGGKVKKKTYYKGFVMLGYITIDKTGVKEPILDEVTPEALDTAVAVL